MKKTDPFEHAIQNSCVAIKSHEDRSADGEIVRIPNAVAAAWGYRKDLWENGSILRYRFINGDTRQKNAMRAIIADTDSRLGIVFKEVSMGVTVMRIGFDLNAGHWSYVGKGNLRVPQNQKTMNIGLRGSASPKEWSRVGYHELFHFLGLNHEHQHPKNTIQWNYPAVYRLYMTTQGWSKAEIDFQVLQHPTEVGMVGTAAPDPKSIMMYPIEPSLVLDPKYAVGWNMTPDQTDWDILARFYPNNVIA